MERARRAFRGIMARIPKASQTVLALALLLCAATGIARLRLAEGVRDRFLPDDPTIASLEREEQLFGPSKSLVILVESDRAFVPEKLLGELRAWRSELGEIAGVHSVGTILDLPTVAWDSPSHWRVVAVED